MPKVSFKQEYCKSCGLCLSVCPMKIIHIENNKLNIRGFYPATVKEIAKCTGCGSCATICPDCVITVINGED